MLWNLEKLEKERIDLIEVITALSHTKCLSQTDRTAMSEEISAHMGRLSDLDSEKQRLESALEVC